MILEGLLQSIFFYGVVFGDPCTSYTELGSPDDHIRSLANSDITTTLCDSQLTEGWYRIPSKSGERMPTECIIGGMRCGAMNPLWMEGVFPETGNISNVTAYVSGIFGDCKEASYNISVKNCSSYLVYHLKPTVSCDHRYCFGAELPCPTGTLSANGFSPGCRYDECAPGNYEILDQWHRSIGNADGPNLSCDNMLQPGWYKPISVVGNLMPTECPEFGFRCGTINPIWMNDTYPIQGQTKTVQGCVSSYNGGCCIETYDIDIRNCGDFYIYNLKPTEGCYKGYCFGNESKCPTGQTSDNQGFTPDCEFDPCHEINFKVLSGEEKRSSNYTIQADDVVIEDSRLTPGWYRIDSVTGNDIVNESVPLYQCSTVYPLWMIGSLPSKSDKTVTRKVCKTGLLSDCEREYEIQVRNCGNYRTYNLPQLLDEKAAYCFGTLPVPEPTTTTTTTTTTTRKPTTTTTTTTRRPTTNRHEQDDRDDEDDDDDGEDKVTPVVMAAISVLSLLCVILLLVLICWCYKTKSVSKRAVSFIDPRTIDECSTPPPPYVWYQHPPSYDEANQQNDKNNIIQAFSTPQVGPTSTKLGGKKKY